VLLNGTGVAAWSDQPFLIYRLEFAECGSQSRDIGQNHRLSFHDSSSPTGMTSGLVQDSKHYHSLSHWIDKRYYCLRRLGGDGSRFPTPARERVW
jgi:hypothetical protein